MNASSCRRWVLFSTTANFSVTGSASPSWRRIASVTVSDSPSCIRRLRVRTPQSGAVHPVARGRGPVLDDAVAGADVVEQEVAERVDDLVAHGGHTVSMPPLIGVPIGDVTIVRT